jgi:ElaB/YqjD/DUF883 family membrane-anchored ribosome-binding protein
MHAPANQPDFQAQTASTEAGSADARTDAAAPPQAAAPDPAIAELTGIVDQAEALLRSLSEHSGDAAHEVRERVTETLNQAKARLAVTASQAEEAAVTLVDRADDYVRRNPWQAVTLAALLGGVVAYLFARSVRKK